MVLNILKSDTGYPLLFEYCQHEFSLENILLWSELETIRSQNLLMTPEERKNTLHRLKQLYIDRGSARELNISNQDKKFFLRVLSMEEPSAADAEDVYTKLYGACMLNLSDTLLRFMTTESYHTFHLASQTTKELQDEFARVT